MENPIGKPEEMIYDWWIFMDFPYLYWFIGGYINPLVYHHSANILKWSCEGGDVLFSDRRVWRQVKTHGFPWMPAYLDVNRLVLGFLTDPNLIKLGLLVLTHTDITYLYKVVVGSGYLEIWRRVKIHYFLYERVDDYPWMPVIMWTPGCQVFWSSDIGAMVDPPTKWEERKSSLIPRITGHQGSAISPWGFTPRTVQERGL